MKLRFKLSFIILLAYTGLSFGQQVNSASIEFVRPSSTIGSFSAIQISINDQTVGEINNGSNFSYKLFITSKGSFTLKVSSAIYSKSITFDVEPGKTYFFETSFQEQGVFLLAIDQNAYNRHLQALSTQQPSGRNNQTSVSGLKSPETTGTVPTTQLDINKDTKSITYQYEKELDSEAIRKQWLESGGSIKGTSYIVGGSVLYKELGDFELSGYGLSAAYNQNFINLRIPEYGPGRKSWSSFHWGYGFSASYFYTIVENIWGDYDIEPMESTFGTININLNLGLHYGTGVFIDRTSWKGAVIELNYKPSLIYAFPEEGDATYDFNFTGFSFDINSSDFKSTMNKVAPKANFKFSLFVLPPVNDLPFFLSISLGAVWYSK
jgi:hypothetical protein